MSERALVRNAGDPKQVKRAAKTERQIAVEEAGHLESVLTTYDGRALLWRILGHAGVYEQSYRGEATHETSFQEGKRSVGNWLMAVICRDHLPSYHLMQTEAAKRAENVQEPPPKSDEPFPITEPAEDDDGN